MTVIIDSEDEREMVEESRIKVGAAPRPDPTSLGLYPIQAWYPHEPTIMPVFVRLRSRWNDGMVDGQAHGSASQMLIEPK